MAMNRTVVVLGLAALGASQVGCVDPCAESNNGNDGVLNFRARSSPARGMQTQVNLLRQNPAWWEGPFWFTRHPASCFQFDDTEVQVTLPASFQGEVATVEQTPSTVIDGAGEDFAIRFSCSAPAEEVQEVAVRVMAGDVARYEDSFDVTCHTLVSAAATPVQVYGTRPLTGKGFVVGGEVHATISLQGSSSELTGTGVAPADSLLVAVGEPSRDLWPQPEKFRVAAPGQSPALQVGPIRTVLPITLVGDEAWGLGLEIQPTGTPGSFAFSAWPTSPGGDKLDGVDACQWTAFTATDSEVLPDTACDMTHSNLLAGTNRFVTRMCVTALGRTSCVAVPA